MEMDHDDAKEFLKSRLGDYLCRYHGLRHPNMSFRCVNRSAHKRGDANPSMHYYADKQKCICFACGAAYDIFSLIQEDYNLPGFNEAFKKACEMYDIEVKRDVKRDMAYKEALKKKMSENPVCTGGHNCGYVSSTTSKKIPDQLAYYRRCVIARKSNDRALSYLHGRGLSDEILDRFLIGFDPAWHHPYTRNKNTERIIIPNSRTGYLARTIDDTLTLGKYDHKKMKVGEQNLFNLQAVQPDRTIIVVEGEIDAMSVEQLGFPCLGLGSTSQYAKLARYCDEHPERIKGSLFMVALDNDMAGTGMAKKLSDALTSRLVRCVRYPKISGFCKDPNERLQREPVKMRRDIEAVYRACEDIRKNHVPEYILDRAKQA